MRLFPVVCALFAVDLLFAVLLPAREAGAGTALRLDLPSLVQRSDLIVEARVLAAHTLETEDLLLTEYVLEVSRTFKGADQTYRALRLPGGVRADGSGLLIPGVPHLALGEEVLLFLEPEGRAGARMSTGLAQGKFSVQRGVDGAKLLVRDVSSLALVGAPDSRRGRRSVVDYADLVAAVAAALGQQATGR